MDKVNWGVYCGISLHQQVLSASVGSRSGWYNRNEVRLPSKTCSFSLHAAVRPRCLTTQYCYSGREAVCIFAEAAKRGHVCAYASPGRALRLRQSPFCSGYACRPFHALVSNCVDTKWSSLRGAKERPGGRDARQVVLLSSESSSVTGKLSQASGWQL